MSNLTIENGICVACDRPVIYDDGSDEPSPDDKCLRSKSYCTDREAHIDWRLRWKAAQAENANLREFIASSEECAKAQDIVAVYENNERYRKAFNEIIAKLEAKAPIHHAHCSWCEEKWPHLDGGTAEEARAQARSHAFKCKRHPLKLERDAIAEQCAALKSALHEACEVAELALHGGRLDAAKSYLRRITELRKLTGGEL